MSDHFFQWMMTYQSRLSKREQAAFAQQFYQLLLRVPFEELDSDKLPEDPPTTGADSNSKVLQSFEHYLKCKKFYETKCPNLSEKERAKKIIALDWSYVETGDLTESELERIYLEEESERLLIENLYVEFDEDQKPEFYKLHVIEGLGAVLSANLVRNSRHG
jgi:hypothetical protein